MDRGVDGFRADVVHCIGKSPDLPDMPDGPGRAPRRMLQDYGPGTHEQLRQLRRVVDDAPGERLIVGETYVLDRAQVVSYLGHGDELHLAFNIPALHAPWTAEAWAEEIRSAAALLDPIGGWPTWVLSNHDVSRHRTRYGTEARARAAAVLLLTLRGTPFLYRARSWACRTPRCHRTGWWTPAAGTAAAPPSRGPRAPATAGPWSPGCRSRPIPAPTASRPRPVTPRPMLEHYRRLLRAAAQRPGAAPGRHRGHGRPRRCPALPPDHR